MNGKTVTLLENLCRTCMNGDGEDDKEVEGKKKKTISIFNEPENMECKNITIMELLMQTIPQLNIEYGDMLPKVLCERCLERLISVYTFQKMCIRVEQKFRQRMKEENLVESKTNNDPLKDSLMDIAIENVHVSEAINDLTNILKIEMDEPLIEQDESIFNNKSIDRDTDDIKFETDDNQWEDVSDSTTGDVDSDSEWETTVYNAKGKRGLKMIQKLNERIDKNSEDSAEEERNSESKKSSKTTSSGTDSENKKFVCDECGNRLSTRKSLKRHKRIHLRPVVVGKRNKVAKPKHECDFCKKVFQQSSSLKDHLRTHTGEQPYLCSECGKAFKSLSNMKQHFLRHGTDRPYVCPDCPKRFPCISDLASHKAVHNKTKSHVCDICGAAFVKPYLLKKHKMYHTGEKNHKCDYCDMRFVLADQCRRHMRTHTGEKPYKCKYCERAFAQSNDLIKHLRGHLGDNVYKCDLCPQGFRLLCDLRAHFNTHKNDDEETRARNLQAMKDEEHKLQIKFGFTKCT